MAIIDALRAVQANLRAPKGQVNSFGKYNYRSAEDILEAVKPLLNENGLVLTISDEPVAVNGVTYICARAKVTDAEGAEVSVTGWAREPASKKGMDDAQITGATSSYARKYAMNGLFAIDDAKDADTDEHARTQGKTQGKSPGKAPAKGGAGSAKPAADPALEKARDAAKKALSANSVPPAEFRTFLHELAPFWDSLKDVDSVEACEKIIDWAKGWGAD